ncbi:MAG: hypothetical protein LBI86_00940 [Treponema sp.]|jgi:hypothetical protein|nr:hypothetical protein [Treponema sp.]
MKRPGTGKEKAYREATGALRRLFRRDRGVTAADLAAATAIPLSMAREILPLAADEYGGRLEVTESGEILYSFPRGFTSRYRGFRAVFSRGLEKAAACLFAVFSWLFKIWIMVMLVGYFALFMLIALASLVLSAAAARSSNSNSRSGRDGGAFFAGSLFNLVIRLWFYSELTRPRERGRYGARASYGEASRSGKAEAGQPLHRRIFAFVFGEEDPNRGWASREKKSVIAYLRSHSGIMALPEFMALTGLSPDRAEEEILAFCREFGGMPEASPGGTVIYRFDEILTGKGSAGGEKAPAFSRTGGEETAVPFKRPRIFSANTKSMNGWFAVINGVNLLFGSYFLYNAVTAGPVSAGPETKSLVYAVVTSFLAYAGSNPGPAAAIGLGVVPLVFSVLFWLVPALRFCALKKENGAIRLENFRKEAFGRIWEKPAAVRVKDMTGGAAGRAPDNPAAACDRVILDMGAYSIPEVTVPDGGGLVYNFTALAAEKDILEKCRAGVKSGDPGKTVFDSDA